MSARWTYLVALVLMGATWGITQPLSKIAVVEGGYRHVGLVFWQMTIGAVILTAVIYLRGKRLSLAPQHLAVYAVIAVLGTVLPNSASYTAAEHLPSGILSIVLSLVPILAFPIAMAFGMDRFSALRFLGLALGLCAIALIALPEASLPDRAMVAWLPIALIAPAFYALEGNLVARYGTFGLDPVQVLAGASILGAILVAPVAILTGHFIDLRPPYGPPEFAIFGNGIAHALAYSTYVWLVGRAGAVFAAQVAYLVTGFGIVWAAILLSETYSPWVWGALALMFVGLFLVQPRPARAAQPVASAGEAGGP